VVTAFLCAAAVVPGDGTGSAGGLGGRPLGKEENQAGGWPSALPASREGGLATPSASPRPQQPPPDPVAAAGGSPGSAGAPRARGDPCLCVGTQRLEEGSPV